MTVSRERAWFRASSRIYTQAEAGASTLLDRIGVKDAPFLARTRQELRKQDLLVLRDKTTRTRAATAAMNLFKAATTAIDTRISIPTLLVAADRYYYGNEKYKLDAPWLGTALKTAIAFIWRNLRNVHSTDRSIGRLLSVVEIAGAWEQLQTETDDASVFELGVSLVEDSGIRRAPEDMVRVARRNETYAKRGLLHRTLLQSQQAIWRDPSAFVRGAKNVLGGTRPTDIEIFGGTLFQELDVSKSEFWLGLYLRVLLFAMTSQIRQSLAEYEQIGPGLVLFEELGLSLAPFSVPQETVQQAGQELFWRSKWYETRIGNYPSNMIVERPALRIDNRTFAVTQRNILDSINAFVEHSVMGYKGFGGVDVGPHVFDLHIARPFEHRAVGLFREKGWQAGSVTADGFWNANNTRLQSPSGDQIPGEIDVLAIAPDASCGIVLECKVLNDPIVSGKLINVSGKLGSKDDELFHAKLRKKLAWVRTLRFCPENALIGAILVDRGAYLGMGAEHLVMDFDDLSDFLSSA